MTINRPHQTASSIPKPQHEDHPPEPTKSSLTRREFEQYLHEQLEQMFRRLEHNLPAGKPLPRSLEELGFQVTEEGKIISTGKHGTAGATAGRLFTFYNYYWEPANHMRKESVHRAVRSIVFEKLRCLGLKELFLEGDDGSTITMDRPTGPHINILATSDLEDLKSRRDVVIIIGEHTQDLAIWAWREIMGRHGLESGSAIGLARRLAKGRLKMPKAAKQAEREKEHQISMMKLEFGDAVPVDDNRFTTGTDKAPAIILLNPGQRLFSHDMNTNMTLVSWLYRDRIHVQQRPHAVDETHNLVPGHQDPLSHIGTVFAKVLPQLLSATADIYVVGISDSARDFARFMDSELFTNPNTVLAEQVKAFAAIEPTFQPEDIETDVMKTFLHHCARSWVCSDEPKGLFLSAPGAYNPMPVVNDVTPFNAKSGHEGGEDIAHGNEGDKHGDDENGADDDLVVVSNTPDEETSWVNASLEGEPVSEIGTAEESGEAKVSTIAAVDYATKESEEVKTTDIPAADEGVVAMEDPTSPVTLNSTISGENEDHLNDTYYEYAKKPVLTPTFSAGAVSDTELVWPTVMDDVLLYFRGVALSQEKYRKMG